MIENQHLICAPEIRRYKLVSLVSDLEIMVTDSMLKEGFKDNPSELQKIYSGRSLAWFLEEVFE
ncbi:hypothetical protein [Kosakonia phage Kc304]|uniref:Uncharacterized protein n=3 Tax=Winklervirus TaxID=2560256 RepID=A0A1Z1LY36_9CAUD|nr:hypothetical protein FDI23_gp053 [Serratia phage CHI14]ARW57751.1 hypothetical protein [Serratia phage CBH8]QYN80497.1 hypothetical protein [Kosakonia phage Kc304]UJJ22035.1 hypothetical protein [Erwinia phage Virsaitis27]UYM28705.1 hypothetical protein [Serratia phage vB_SspM_LC53]ARW57476.1 hypothetical protein [Serratia phage CHI14]